MRSSRPARRLAGRPGSPWPLRLPMPTRRRTPPRPEPRCDATSCPPWVRSFLTTGGRRPRRLNPRLHVLQLAREIAGEQPVAVRRDQHLVLDSDAEVAFRDVDARLHREDRA